MNSTFTIALPKGRLGDVALKRLQAAGMAKEVNPSSRRLVFNDVSQAIRYMIVKPIDVITYVEQGVADIGIIGRDGILEAEADIYELMDLGFGQCRFAIAGPKDNMKIQKDETLRVATKYPRFTKTYFKNKGQKIIIIPLNGSVELAPLVGLSDVIVDIVETGNTLKANGLEIITPIQDISAKLISNRASYRFKYERIRHIIRLLDQTKEANT